MIGHSKIRSRAGVLADIAAELSSTVNWEDRVRNALSLLYDAVPAQVTGLGVEFQGWRVFLCPEESGVDLAGILAEHYSMLTGVASSGPESLSSSGDESVSFLSMPVIGADEVMGVLHTRVDQPEAYSLDDASALSVVALQIGSFLKNVQAQMEIAQAREQAEYKSAQMEAFISSAAEGVALFDAEGNVVTMNDAGKTILGVPPGERFDDWEKYQRFTLDSEPIRIEGVPWARALAGETVTDFRYRVVTPWGREVTVSITSAPVKDSEGRVMGATTVFRDVTERVEVERQKEEVLERERHIARVLQEALIPTRMPYAAGGCTVASRYQPALREAEVGGDFYDLFELDEDKVALLVGDVAGKGLQAAVRVAAARYAVRSYAYLDPAPSFVLTHANTALCQSAADPVENMLTAFYAVFDPHTGVLTYASAGHEPPVVCDKDGSIEELEVSGMPLGVLDAASYTESSYSLQPGNAVVIVTDGITEARSGIDLFGKEGLIDYVRGHCACSAEEVVSGLLNAAARHAGGSLQDDAAIVVLKRSADQSSGPCPSRRALQQ